MGHHRTRRLLGTAVALLLLASVAPAAAAPPPLVQQVRVYSYDGRGPALLSVDGEVQAVGRGGLLATVAAEQRGKDLDPFFPDVVELGGQDGPVSVYGAAGDRDLCGAAVLRCEPTPDGDGLGFGISFSIGRSPEPVSIRLYVAAEGTRVRVDETMIGWKVRVRRGGLRHAAEGGTGVRGFGSSLEAQPSASLPGGARGSIGIGVPPCTDLGVGVATLTGGPATVSAPCPTFALAAAANGPTTWTSGGAVAGTTPYRTRLLVIDR